MTETKWLQVRGDSSRTAERVFDMQYLSKGPGSYISRGNFTGLLRKEIVQLESHRAQVINCINQRFYGIVLQILKYAGNIKAKLSTS